MELGKTLFLFIFLTGLWSIDSGDKRGSEVNVWTRVRQFCVTGTYVGPQYTLRDTHAGLDRLPALVLLFCLL